MVSSSLLKNFIIEVNISSSVRWKGKAIWWRWVMVVDVVEVKVVG
jgi:hypothetical protein